MAKAKKQPEAPVIGKKAAKVTPEKKAKPVAKPAKPVPVTMASEEAVSTPWEIKKPENKTGPISFSEAMKPVVQQEQTTGLSFKLK